MTTYATVARKLYLLQLSTTTLPLPTGPVHLGSACYLIETTGGKHVLVDSGMPEDVPPRPGTPPSENKKNVLEHLADLALRPSDLDILVCTHFDVDHAGYHDFFTNAECIVQREHYQLARNNHPRYAPARAHWDHPALHYRMVEGDTELLPGITLLETSGHARGHQSVLVQLPHTGPVLLAIDAVMLERLFTPTRKPWPNDDNEEQLLASTRRLLDIVEQKKVALTIFGHDAQQWQNLKRAPNFYD
ncbi:MAG: N-acyl homoserine lactonase family protein [Candidatus Acidiferrum sp.]|jgi:N-acyl homoserine lactone hydrolase